MVYTCQSAKRFDIPGNDSVDDGPGVWGRRGQATRP